MHVDDNNSNIKIYIITGYCDVRICDVHQDINTSYEVCHKHAQTVSAKNIRYLYKIFKKNLHFYMYMINENKILYYLDAQKIFAQSTNLISKIMNIVIAELFCLH